MSRMSQFSQSPPYTAKLQLKTRHPAMSQVIISSARCNNNRCSATPTPNTHLQQDVLGNPVKHDTINDTTKCVPTLKPAENNMTLYLTQVQLYIYI